LRIANSSVASSQEWYRLQPEPDVLPGQSDRPRADSKHLVQTSVRITVPAQPNSEWWVSSYLTCVIPTLAQQHALFRCDPCAEALPGLPPASR